MPYSYSAIMAILQIINIREQLRQDIIIFLTMEPENDNWKPMESNPQVMNEFVQGLGFNTDLYAVQDVLSVEDWAQDMLPKPIFGTIFLFEINEKQRAFQKQQAKNLEEDKVPQGLFYMKQYAKNACGTIALFHTILNASEKYPDVIKEGSYFKDFYEQSKGKSPKQIGENFKKNKGIKEKHSVSVKKGQTQLKDQVQTHFIAFVSHGDHLYELDGRKKSPVDHGECKTEQLVAKSCEVMKQFMSRDPQSMNFTILAVGVKPQM